jgi:hypothetical protein
LLLLLLLLLLCEMHELITRVKSSTRGISDDTQNFLYPSWKGCRQAGN